jgi:DNA-binding response OmpR family regulator
MSGIILIAEDDELLRHAIVAALRAAGFATVEASDGVEGARGAL